MEPPESEPKLTFRLSDQNEFLCLACGRIIASVGNDRSVVVELPDLIALFKKHVELYHPTRS
jgi:hypothetical protein